MIRSLALAALLVPGQLAAGETTRLKRDEQIVFYPTLGWRTADAQEWEIEIRGCVFEPERQRLLLATLREALELKHVEMSPAEEKVFKERARWFLVDHERGKKIFASIGGAEFLAGKSGADGNFTRLVKVRAAGLAQGSGAGVPFAAVLSPGDARQFTGEVFFLEDEGVSVISDIDDTIKLTEVRDRRAMLRNTFLREFRSAPGMAEFYQALARSNAATFHYVSASPWQLYEPLSTFVRSNGFPAGTFHLKEFRWKDRSFFSLFAGPVKYKLSVIEPLLKRFPQRKFILVGDSGESDPEIYGELARKFPGQIAHIYIRDVTGDRADGDRYAKAFGNVPIENWELLPEVTERSR